MVKLIIEADLSSEELQVLISEITILHRDVFHKQLVLQQTDCKTLLICPQCENPYPHTHTDGSHSCEECGRSWAN